MVQLHHHVLVGVFRQRLAGEVRVRVVVVVGAARGEVEEEWLLGVLALLDEAHRVVGQLLVDETDRVVVDREHRFRLFAAAAFDYGHGLALGRPGLAHRVADQVGVAPGLAPGGVVVG
ncbi:hypothetical protein D3C85_1223110 [compost metagenome]